ncbi:MAG: hypothetical protein QXW00_04440 [Candidatus Woesearchaeota archaeon]
MQKKLRELIEEVNYEDLYKMKADLEQGGIHLKKLVEKKIKDIESENIKVCATCGNAINLLTSRSYTLIFGPPDLKKRAHFCGIDCLEYFVQNLKQAEKERIKKVQAFQQGTPKRGSE